MLVIGLTGGIASGKSTVSSHLAKLGAIIIDADKLAREVVEPGQPGLDLLVQAFGSEILQEDGTLNRGALGKLVFSRPEQRASLDRITLPLIIEKTQGQLAALSKRPDSAELIVVLDAPLLLEAGLTTFVDRIWVVALPKEVQLQRLMERDGFTRDQALARLRSQMPLENKLAQADQIIWNDGSIDDTLAKVTKLWAKARNMISE